MKHLPADSLGSLGVGLGLLRRTQRFVRPHAVLGTAADAAEVAVVDIAATQPWCLLVWEEGR